MKKCLLHLLVAGALLFVSSYAHAQTVSRSAEADVVQKQQAPPLMPTATPEIEAPPELAVQVPEGADQVRFVLNRLTIEGSTAYTPEELAVYYADKLSKEVTLADIYIIAALITQRYQADGYLISKAFLPPQSISGGEVQIQVVEGYISNVEWKGDILEEDLTAVATERLRAMRPLSGREMESIILMLNDRPGLQVQATLTPGEGEESAVGIVMNVERKRLSAELSVDNYASRYLGVWQASAQTSINGLLTSGDKIALNLTSSLDPQFLNYARGEYSIVLNKFNTVFRVGTSRSKSQPGYLLETLDVESEAATSWIGFSQSIIRSRDQNLFLSTQFNLHNQETHVGGARLSEDRIRTLQVSGIYSFADRLSGSNVLGLDVFKGLNMLNATETGTADLSRAAGHSDFIKATFNAVRTQPLSENWSVQLAATGQLSNSQLLSSEQFGYGGASFGRAYDTYEISRDEGLAASVEITYNTPLTDDILAQPYVFYDIGKGWNDGADSDERSGASAGLGTRFRLFDMVQWDIGVAKPLTTPAASPKMGSSGNDPRVNTQIRIAY